MRTQPGVESKKVKRSIFSGMWKFLISLVVEGKLKKVFDRRELVVATSRYQSFQSPANLDEFLRWARVREKIIVEGVGALTKYRPVIDPIEYLPEKAKVYFKDRGLHDFVVNSLLAIKDKARKTVSIDDIVFAVLSFAKTEINADQALIVANFLVKEEMLEVVTEGSLYTVSASESPKPKVGLEYKFEHKTNELKGGAKVVHNVQPKTLISDNNVPKEKTAAVKNTSSVYSGSVVLTEKLPDISLDNLNKMFPLFLKTARGPFRIMVRDWVHEFGFATEAVLNNVFFHLRKAGWLLKIDLGVGKWNLEKVAPQWVAVLDGGKPLQDTPKKIMEPEEDDNDFIPAEAKELELANTPPPEQKLEVVSPTAKEKEVESEKINFLEKQLAEAKRQLADKNRASGLMAASIADMLYRHIVEMPKEVQLEVLSALTVQINKKGK
jgi:hypothetical protein